MNRIIKFRIWEKETNKLVKYSPNWNYEVNEIFELTNSFVFQQFTGLLDKNNKEIYEGDIVSFKDQLYQIKYNKGSFWLDSLNTIGIIWLEGGVEIKGNIFENPDLLNKS